MLLFYHLLYSIFFIPEVGSAVMVVVGEVFVVGVGDDIAFWHNAAEFKPTDDGEKITVEGPLETLRLVARDVFGSIPHPSSAVGEILFVFGATNPFAYQQRRGIYGLLLAGENLEVCNFGTIFLQLGL